MHVKLVAWPIILQTNCMTIPFFVHLNHNFYGYLYQMQSSRTNHQNLILRKEKEILQHWMINHLNRPIERYSFNSLGMGHAYLSVTLVR